MTDKTLRSLVGGDDSLPRLAPDPRDFGSFNNSNSPAARQSVTATISTVLSEVLTLEGKFAINYLRITAMTTDTYTFRMTQDGSEIYNSDITLSGSANAFNLIGGLLAGGSSGGWRPSDPFTFFCEESLTIELSALTDTEVNIDFIARPIQ